MVDLFNQGQNKDLGNIVLSPSPWKTVTFLLLSFAFVTCGLISLISLPNSAALFTDFQLSWSPLILFASAVLFLTLSIIVINPKISVGGEAIQCNTPFNKRSYRWSEVGPFSADVRHTHFTSHHYICAFTKANHDRMVGEKQHQLPTIKNADILIPLRSHPQGKNIKTAQGFAVIINSCRDEFETPSTSDPKHAVRRTVWSK